MLAEDEARRLLDRALFDWTPKQYCEKLSPIESLLQYRFATPKPLKACPGPGCCRTAPLCKRTLLDSHRCSSPLSLINSEAPGPARSSQGRVARRSRSLDGEDRAVQSLVFRERGAWPALRRRSRLRSGLWIL